MAVERRHPQATGSRGQADAPERLVLALLPDGRQDALQRSPEAFGVERDGGGLVRRGERGEIRGVVEGERRPGPAAGRPDARALRRQFEANRAGGQGGDPVGEDTLGDRDGAGGGDGAVDRRPRADLEIGGGEDEPLPPLVAQRLDLNRLQDGEVGLRRHGAAHRGQGGGESGLVDLEIDRVRHAPVLLRDRSAAAAGC